MEAGPPPNLHANNLHVENLKLACGMGITLFGRVNFAAVFSLLVMLGASAHEIQIVAAENFYGGVARQIVGEAGRVRSILSNPSQDPHEFSSDAATARAVADADLVIYSGLGYDLWIDQLLSNQGKKVRVTINVGDLIGAKPGDNPHIWYDPKTMLALARKLTLILSEQDPAGADGYRRNLRDFEASIQPVFGKIRALKSAYENTAVTATEPVFGYMAQELGFKMLNNDFQLKIMNDTEPSAQETAAFEQSLTRKAVRLLFYNGQVIDATTARLRDLAVRSGIAVVAVSETQPPDQASYVAWMTSELDLVQSALQH